VIPFLDLAAPHRDLRDELRAVFDGALDTSQFIGGSMVEGFEADFAAFCETPACVGVNSGTDALRFALMAAGVGAGDVVVTVPLTFIATTEAISQAGAVPEFVDVDPGTLTMDPAALRRYLETACTRDPGTGGRRSRRTGGRVAAIVPVHLYGQVADMDPLLALAAEHGLVVIEDACQAQGADYFSGREDRWRRAGSMGRAAAFSFYPGKNLGACGEAGAITTGDPDLARRCRLLRDHGQSAKYRHEIEGYNGRLDAIQAGILRVKLRHLAKWNDQRRGHAARYDDLLEGLRVERVATPDWSRPVFHLYVVQADDRERLQADLTRERIGSGIHYPTPLHLLPPYAGLGFVAGDFPVAEQAAARVLSLPMFPELSAEQQHAVAGAIGASLARRAG
jgi:dTDP-4-amino-4,6-dideoxygalactose transaminase